MNHHDSHQWLEEVEGEAALAWVREQNAHVASTIAADPRFRPLRTRLLAALDSDERIPYVAQRGTFLTNFWRDAAHPRGLWRRTTLADYAAGNPDWEVLLDLDRLAEAEGENWVYAGSELLRPTFDRAMILLSRGGADAVVLREFDLTTQTFVADGFALPEAKLRLTWIDRDTTLVGTDFGPGSLTASGYPRLVKRWTRGTPIDEAELLFEGAATDVAVGAFHIHDTGRTFVYRRVSFFTEEIHLVTAEGLRRLDKPDSAELNLHHDHALLHLREDWRVAGTLHPAGSLLVQDLEAWLEGGADWQILFRPTERSSLVGTTTTRSHVVVNTLDDVKNRLFVWSRCADGWTAQPLLVDDSSALDSVQVSAVDPYDSDELWVHRTGFTTPTSFGRIALPDGDERVLRQLTPMYDAREVEVRQHFATSRDGTRVPYFQVGKRPVLEGGPAPTLIRGYGGFEVALTPTYEVVSGIAWIEEGGVYVVANIRGGGEYGPTWHRAALKQHRHRAYEDFEAIGRDLVDRGVTTTAQLGIRGGSNGGLLMGNMYVRSPEQWGAIVSQVPLLDMKRYTKLLAGASWEEEYGDPDDPEQWSFLERFSPYHQLGTAASPRPPLLLTTSTRDDRVHPGHARKFRAALEELGQPDVWYYENMEGGHGGAANNEQTAHLNALAYTFLWRILGPGSR